MIEAKRIRSAANVTRRRCLNVCRGRLVRRLGQEIFQAGHVKMIYALVLEISVDPPPNLHFFISCFSGLLLCQGV